MKTTREKSPPALFREPPFLRTSSQLHHSPWISWKNLAPPAPWSDLPGPKIPGRICKPARFSIYLSFRPCSARPNELKSPGCKRTALVCSSTPRFRHAHMVNIKSLRSCWKVCAPTPESGSQSATKVPWRLCRSLAKQVAGQTFPAGPITPNGRSESHPEYSMMAQRPAGHQSALRCPPGGKSWPPRHLFC